MPPANSPSVSRNGRAGSLPVNKRQQTPVEPPGTAPYLGLLSGATASVPDLASTLAQDEDADRDNVQFLRSTLAQLDDEAHAEARIHTGAPREVEEGSSFSANISSSERETVRRLRRYVFQGGRTTSAYNRDAESRQRYHQARISEYQGWAPGPADSERGEPLVTFSDLRALARGYSRDEQDSQTIQQYREQAAQAARTITNIERRRARAEQEMDWEPGRFLYTDSYTPAADSSLRTTALLQSVRRHARFSPRPLTPSEQMLASAERDHSLRRLPRASSRERPGDQVQSSASRDAPRTQQDIASAEALRWLEKAIIYLERLRACKSTLERLQTASASGFVSGKFFLSQGQTEDFITDTACIPPPARSSWLRTGSVFSGCQRGTAFNNISLASSAAHTSRRAPNRPNDPYERDTELLSIGARGANTSYRNSWVNRVIAHTEGDSGSSGPVASNGTGNGHEESWPVTVTITSVDYDTMSLTGTMQAFDVPNKSNPTQVSTIATYLEGEIIDFNQHTLETTSFDAETSIDSKYWRVLEPFHSLPDHVVVQCLLSQKWLQEELHEKYVLMRWKEKCFITPADAQVHLTISGFYYVSLRRSDGRLEGLYHDPKSSPYQHLSLKADSRQFPAVEMR